MFMRSFFARKTKKLLVFENEFHQAICKLLLAVLVAINKLHLAVLVAIRKSQLAVHKKASKKWHVKILMKLTPGGKLI
jgi:hypothetical protein